MSKIRKLGSLNIENINLWAHVGVLDEERLLGQEFILNITLWVDLERIVDKDCLSQTVDYTTAVKCVQELSFKIKCKTIEYFAECILDSLESIYGEIPMEIRLLKCSPPIDGFSGTVSITSNRYIY